MLDKLGGPKRAGLIFLAVVLFAAFAGSLWFIMAGDNGGGEPELAAAAGEPFPIIVFESPGGAVDPLSPAGGAPATAAVGAELPAYDPGPAATIAALQAQVTALQGGGGAASGSAGVGAAPPPGEPVATPTPETPATPDVAELVRQAVEEDRRQGDVSPVLQISPLDRDRSGRNPYLNEYEMDYFVALGEHFWTYARAWLVLRNIVLVDVDGWTPELLAYEVESLNSILAPVKGREINPDSQVRELVYVYGEQLQDGFLRVDESVERLKSALVTVVQTDGEQLTDSQRNSLIALRREILQNLEEYHRVMSSYGCSVCGELFRQSQYR